MTDQEKIKEMIEWYLKNDWDMDKERKYIHLSSIVEYAESCGNMRGIDKAFETMAKK